MMPAISVPASWRLSELLAGIVSEPISSDITVSGLALNSHAVQSGDLFMALSGSRSHGLDYLQQALHRGAAAVLWEPCAEYDFSFADCPVPHVPIAGLANSVGPIADRFFLQPSSHLSVVGITGTDGKTSVSQFVAQALNSTLHPCGVIGTLGYGLYGKLQSGSHTTPDAIQLHGQLKSIREQRAKWAVMEVSSHGLQQGRVLGTDFDVAVLTNVSRDHIDYHGSVQAYANAKKRLFEMPEIGHAVLNLDDAFGRRLVDELRGKTNVLGYTLHAKASHGVALVRAVDLCLIPTGMSLTVETPWGHGELSTGLLGHFNASNLLAALSVLLVLDLPLDAALLRLSRVHAVAGRMESFGGGEQPTVIVDYAHTPAAMEQVLLALRAHCEGRLWCLFGCGGERDTGKRPQMARVAERLADEVVVTDDNPRNELPEAIVRDILSGFHKTESVRVIHSRGEAIATAIGEATAGDVVLVAGKGHEQEQILSDKRIPFSDREQVMARLSEAAL